MRGWRLVFLLALLVCLGCTRNTGITPTAVAGQAAPEAKVTPGESPTPTLAPSVTPAPTATLTPPVHVLASYPIDGDEAVLDARKLVMTFDRPMNAARVAAALRITPTVAGQVAWPSPQRLEWTPSEPWAKGMAYEWALMAGPLASDSGVLETPFRVRFTSGGRGAPVPILMYHHFAELSTDATEGQRTWTVAPQALEEQLAYLERENWRTIQPGALAAYLSAGEPLPPRSLMITIDDGYREVYEQAYPLFQRTHLRPVLFIITAHTVYPAMMDWAQLQELAQAGFGIGSHSDTHIDLLQKDASLAREIADSQAALAEHLNVQADAFCYPYGGGAWNDTVLANLRAHGYTTGYTLNPTSYQDPNEPLQLGRLRVDYGMTLEDFAALLP